MTGDWQKNLLSATCAIASIVTWVLCLSKGKFKKPDRFECLTLIACFVAIILWQNFGLVKESNLVLQVDNAISFIPIISGVIRNPSKEKPAAWMLWTVSYILGTLVVWLRFEQWNDLVYPINNAILCLIIGALALRKGRT